MPIHEMLPGDKQDLFFQATGSTGGPAWPLSGPFFNTNRPDVLRVIATEYLGPHVSSNDKLSPHPRPTLANGELGRGAYKVTVEYFADAKATVSAQVFGAVDADPGPNYVPSSGAHTVILRPAPQAVNIGPKA